MMHPIQETILTHLAASRSPVSGRALAERLGISRTAIWKHIQAMRVQGIQIESESGRGYLLESDHFTADALALRLTNNPCDLIGHSICYLKSTDSTNLEALRAADNGSQEGLIIIAEQQQQGRGRLGRTWHTLNIDSLAMTVLLRPPLPPEQVPQIPLIVGVSLVNAFKELGAKVSIKWPNDILCGGAKVAGILTEMRSEPGHVQAVVVGIGINIRYPQGGWPADINQAVTDLVSAAHKPLRRLDVAEKVIRCLDTCYKTYLHEGFGAFRDIWWASHAASDAQVRVHDGRAYIQGTAIAIDHDGALLLDTKRGVHRVIAGDLELMKDN